MSPLRCRLLLGFTNSVRFYQHCLFIHRDAPEGRTGVTQL